MDLSRRVRRRTTSAQASSSAVVVTEEAEEEPPAPAPSHLRRSEEAREISGMARRSVAVSAPTTV
jgi:hypothetical protein